MFAPSQTPPANNAPASDLIDAMLESGDPNVLMELIESDELNDSTKGQAITALHKCKAVLSRTEVQIVALDKLWLSPSDSIEFNPTTLENANKVCETAWEFGWREGLSLRWHRDSAAGPARQVSGGTTQRGDVYHYKHGELHFDSKIGPAVQLVGGASRGGWDGYYMDNNEVPPEDAS